MAKRARTISVHPPMGGLNTRASYRQQPPYTSFSLQNVVPLDTLESRRRLGSRGGLGLTHIDELGSANPVRGLWDVTWLDDGGQDYFTEQWSVPEGATIGNGWTSIAGGLTAAGDGSVYLPAGDASGGFYRTETTVDDTAARRFGMYLLPSSNGSMYGHYYIVLNQDAQPTQTEAFWLRLELNPDEYYAQAQVISSGSQQESWTDDQSGIATTQTPGWLILDLSPAGDSTYVKVYWRGTEIISQTSAYDLTGDIVRINGFRTVSTLTEPSWWNTVEKAARIGAMFYSYNQTGSLYAKRRRQLMATSNGKVYKEALVQQMTDISATLTIASDREVMAAERGQKLYIADWGQIAATGTDGVRGTGDTKFDSATYTNWTTGPEVTLNVNDFVVVISSPSHSDITAGTYEISTVATGELTLAVAPFTGANGTCTFRIERAPKVYDPSDDSLALMVASTGQVPTGCPLIARYRDRIVFAGEHANPHVWYMSRQSTPLDFNYSSDGQDQQRAVAGTDANAGTMGEPITALMTHSDDYLVFGCISSLWRLEGDPAAFDGELVNLSRRVGVRSANSWCHGPNGEILFLAHDGVYMLPPGGKAYPQGISEHQIPEDLANVDPTAYTITMAYDSEFDGVWIFMTAGTTAANRHFWMDWETKSFWPVVMQGTHEAFSVIEHIADDPLTSGVIIGARDGHLRKFDADNQDDDGTDITNYAYLGPIPLAPDGREGMLVSIEAAVAEESGDITWNLYAAATFEDVWDASSAANGTWSYDSDEGLGLSFREYPRVRGMCALLKLAGSGSTRWAMERITAKVRALGTQRRVT